MTVLEKIKRCVSLVWDFQEIYGEEDIEDFCRNELRTYPQHDEIMEYFKHIENLEKNNEWHYVKDGDLPKKEGRYYCIIETAIVTGGYKYDIEIKSRGRNVHSKKWYWADYSDPTWYEWKLMKVYAWKEIVLPELPKEGE